MRVESTSFFVARVVARIATIVEMGRREPADDGLAVLSDARDEAKRVLLLRPYASVVGAFKMLGGTAAFTACFTVALIFLKEYSSVWLVGAIAVSFAVAALSYVTNELERLNQCREALQGLLRAEKNFEALLADVRNERDQIEERKQLLLAERAVTVAVLSARRGGGGGDDNDGDG